MPSPLERPPLVAQPAASTPPPKKKPLLHPVPPSQSPAQTAESGLVLLEGPCICAPLTKKINTSATHTHKQTNTHKHKQTQAWAYSHTVVPTQQGTLMDPLPMHANTRTFQPHSKPKTEGTPPSPTTHTSSFILPPSLQAVDHSKSAPPFPPPIPAHFK